MEEMIVEDDNVVKVMTNLVRDLDIRKLVIGITKSNLRYVFIVFFFLLCFN